MDFDKGQLIGRYGQSRSFRFALYGLAALFLVVGVFVLFLAWQVRSGGVKFTGDISILYATGFGGIGVALAIGIGTWLLVASQPTYFLYENAIHAVGRNFNRLDRYDAIEDLFHFFWGGFGYRANPASPWIFAGARNSRIGQLTENLRNLHAARRGAVLYERLRAGQAVTFRCVPEDVALSKSLVATRNMDFPTTELELTADQLKIDGKAIEIARIGEFRGNLWTERCKIVDVDGAVFHSMHITSIMSPDALLYLIERLQAERRAA
jgi:hypothetical protein